MIRTSLFWLHLAFGVTAGVIIFVMSFTGAALALQPQILAFVEREQREVAVPAGRSRLSVETLIARVKEQKPDAVVTGITIDRTPDHAATVTLAPAITAYVDPYTGSLTGVVQQQGARKFFRSMTDWHRWLGQQGPSRDGARWITGISNAAFLGLAVTGLFLWWPRVWSWVVVSSVTIFRFGLKGKARDFNWHNVMGAWSAPVLIVLTFTGMCISFPKTYDVIYAVTGLERPAAAAARPAATAGAPIMPAGLDAMWLTAEQQLVTWKTITIRLPSAADQPVTFTMNDSTKLNPMARSTLTMNAVDRQIVKWDPNDAQPPGQRLRTWMRFGHTGELWGLPGQIVAGLASAAGCVLVWTGISLAIRRLLAWTGRRARRRAAEPDQRLAA